MSATRVTSSIAIVLGGCLGAVGAWVVARTTAQHHDSVAVPAQTRSVGAGTPATRNRLTIDNGSSRRSGTSTAPRSPSTARTIAASDQTAVSTTEPSAGASPALSLFAPVTTEAARSRAEHSCGIGSGQACLRLAISYEGSAADPKQASRFYRLARGMLIRQCQKTDAYACFALAQMYAKGKGFARSETDEHALTERARMLCRMRKQPACQQFFPELSADKRPH